MKNLGLKTASVVLLFMFAVSISVAPGCGKTNSETPPNSDAGPSLKLEAYGPRGSATDSSNTGDTLLRANGRDTMEIVATVRGLSALVGFFIAADWGTWIGGLAGDDGFTYYTADKNGKAKAVLQAGANAGKQEVIARSQDVETRLLVTFDLATLTIFPSTIVLNVHRSSVVKVVARGGLPPIEWWVSHPLSIGVQPLDETGLSIHVYGIDPDKSIGSATLPTGGGQLYAKDSEGQITSAAIYWINTDCSEATITISPATGATGTNVSVTVSDPDLVDTTSVTVSTDGTLALGGATSITLNEISSGAAVFSSGSVAETHPAAGTYTVYYTDPASPSNNCQSATVSATFTGT